MCKYFYWSQSVFKLSKLESVIDMRHSVVIALVAIGISCVDAQRISGGSCPDVSVKSNFDVGKFTGLWYEIEAIQAPFEYEQKCITLNFEDKGDYVSISGKGINVITGEEVLHPGKFTSPDPNARSKLLAEYFDDKFKGEIWILDTDYENYFLSYSCSSFKEVFKTQFIWIYSRQPTLDDGSREKIYKFLEDNGVSKEDLKLTVQDCA